jgi:Ni/Fe-hydrogenase subunit HybB-like protein
MFSVEVLIGVALPLKLFMSDYIRKSPEGLFIASSLEYFGGVYE